MIKRRLASVLERYWVYGLRHIDIVGNFCDFGDDAQSLGVVFIIVQLCLSTKPGVPQAASRDVLNRDFVDAYKQTRLWNQLTTSGAKWNELDTCSVGTKSS